MAYAKKINNPTLGTPTLTLGSDATGDIFYRSAGGTVNRLSIGSTGLVLVSDGTNPAWGTGGTTIAGVGTVVAGSNLTGGTITSVGTINMAGTIQPTMIGTTTIQGGTASGLTLNGASNTLTVREADLSLTDITTANVSTSVHGFVPKAPSDTTKYLRGDATWAVVPTRTRSFFISPTMTNSVVGSPALTNLDNMGAFWLLDGSTLEVVGCVLALPQDWSSGNTIKVYWQKTTTAAGNIVFAVRYTAWTPDAASGITGAAGNDLTTITGATNTNINISTLTFTPAGGAAGRFLMMSVGRDATQAADTYDGVDIRFYGFEISYTSSA